MQPGTAPIALWLKILAGVLAAVVVVAWAATDRGMPAPTSAAAVPSPEPRSASVALAATSNGDAIVVRSRVARAELARVDGAGREVWTQRLHDTAPARDRAWLLVDPERGDGLVRYLRGDAMRVRAFANDGRSVWDVPVCTLVQDPAWPLQDETLFRATPTRVLVQCEHDGHREQVALDRATGQRIHRTAARTTDLAMLGGELYDLDTGRKYAPFGDWLRTQGGDWAQGCVADDLIVGLRRHDQTKHLFAFDGQRYVFEVSFASWGVRLLGCARYRDTLVVNYPAGRWASVIGFVDRAGTVLREIATDDPLGGLPRSVGPAPRFMPMLVKVRVRAGAERISALTMLDLARGEVSWTVVTDENLYDQELFRVGGTWYWIVGGEHGPRIVAFDGSTGELAGAVDVKDHVVPVSAASVGGGALWIAGRDPRTRTPRLATLDAATLRPVRVDGLRVVDARARVAAVLATREPGCYACGPRAVRRR